MLTNIILFLIILAAFSLLYWGVQQMGLPPPIKVVVMVICGLVILALIYNFVATGNLRPLR